MAPKGVPTLKVDLAFPEIGQLCSDIIRECYGESFYEIRFRTQKEGKKEGQLLETMDVVVLRGSEYVRAELLSGGASVLASEGVALGIALYQSQYQVRHAGLSIGTLMRATRLAMPSIRPGRRPTCRCFR